MKAKLIISTFLPNVSKEQVGSFRKQTVSVAAENEHEYKTIPQLEKAVKQTKKEMEKAAKDLDFMEAARLRDLMFAMQKRLEEMKS